MTKGVSDRAATHTKVSRAGTEPISVAPSNLLHPVAPFENGERRRLPQLDHTLEVHKRGGHYEHVPPLV